MLRDTRRGFVKTCATVAAGTALGLGEEAHAAENRPNIIYVFTDQQSATMLSCAGNKWLKTPAMDYLAENGVRFERAYTANPVCVPARIGMMSGRFPSAFHCTGGAVRENDGGMKVHSIPEEVKETNIGAQLGKAGYELAYGGKTHLPEPLQPKNLGFEVLTGNERDGLADSCVEFLKRKHDKPYFLMASFINPHDICYMALSGLTFKNPGFPEGKKLSEGPRGLLEGMRLPEGISAEDFFAKYCPPLPPNYEPQIDEPEAIRWLLNLRGFKMKARKEYTDQDWRYHRWAYCRLTEMVDRQIQRLLDALKESGQEQNTVVIFSSDHGDMDASHRMEHKTALYEEAARIPFIVMHKGTTAGGTVDGTHLISNGLDLLPTLCDYAGFAGKAADPRGRSLRPLIEGKPPADWRRTLGVESQIGRMVVGETCKYIRYDQGQAQEQLLDLSKDPHETRHFTNEEDHAATLKALQAAYNEWFPGQ